MRYDPFAARNLFRIVAVAGLLAMMTDVVSATTSLAIGALCLVVSGVLALFSGRAPAAPEERSVRTQRKPDSPTDRMPPDTAPVRPAIKGWKPPSAPAVDAHPAIFATVAGRTTGLGNSARRGNRG